MRSDYRDWLMMSGYQSNTVSAQLHRIGRVEKYYGSIDDVISRGEYEALIAELTYSTADERSNRPNPSKLEFEGNIRNNLQSYRNAVERYHAFVTSPDIETVPEEDAAAARPTARSVETADLQRLSLERDMQTCLRANIGLLEEGLKIVDGGIERGVTSGFIDILCRDGGGRLVVLELKAGKADARVIGQVLGYMGDLAEEEGAPVRGIIVANEFDQRTRSAAKAVPSLMLRRYSISFHFEREI